MNRFEVLLTAPHILTEITNLRGLGGKEAAVFCSLLIRTVEQARETYDESRALVDEPALSRLGVADAAITTLASRGCLCLTDGLDLYLTLATQGADAINFNHLRQRNWR